MPPNRRFPATMPRADDVTVATPESRPSLSHLTFRSPIERCSETEPGVVTNHVPLSFVNWQVALVTVSVALRVATDTTCVEPSIIEAQPPRDNSPVTTHIVFIVFPESYCAPRISRWSPPTRAGYAPLVYSPISVSRGTRANRACIRYATSLWRAAEIGSGMGKTTAGAHSHAISIHF